MIRRLLPNSIITAILLVLFSPLSMMAQTRDGESFYAETIEGIKMGFRVISIEEKTCKVDAVPPAESAVSNVNGHVTIPEEANGFKVTCIGEYAFNEVLGLTGITIPNSVTRIEAGAFMECEDLQSITIPSSVISLGELSEEDEYDEDDEPTDDLIVFWGCKNLKSIHIEEGNPKFDSRNDCNAIIETASNTLLYGCMNTIIPNSVTSIGLGAFAGHKNLKSINIPNSVININHYAFSASGLKEVKFSNSLINIGVKAFQSTNLKELYLPNSVINIGRGAFSDCELLTTIFIPKSLAKIGDEAFYCYEGAISNIYSEIEEPFAINEYTFNKETYANCKLHVPYGTTSKYQAKAGWRKFENIIDDNNINQDIIYEQSIEGVLIVYTIMSDSEKTCRLMSVSESAIGHVTIPEVVQGFTVTDIGYRAFDECVGLTGVTIPNTVTKIDGGAFYACENLKSLNIPSSVNNMGTMMEHESDDDDEPTPQPATDNNKKRLRNNKEQNIIVGPIAIGCTSLNSISVAKENTTYDSRNDCNAIIETATNTLLTGCVNTIIPNSVTSIGYGVFAKLENLKTIDIPSSVVNIGDYAFASTGLTHINLPSSVINIGNSAFEDTKLSEIYIPNSVINIGDYAFDCKELSRVYISNSVKRLGDGAFGEKTQLNDIFSEIEEPFAINEYTFSNATYTNCKLHVPYGTTSKYQAQAGWSKFEKIIEPQDGDVFKEITAEGIEMAFTIWSAKDKTCIVGTSSSDAAISNTTTGIVTIPETAKGYKVIGVGEYAFLACTGVTGISIPSSVISLLEYSFSGCSGLSEISLPSGLLWIGEKAFSGCSALTSITIPASVTGFGHEVFIGCTNLSDVYSEIIKPFDLYDDVFRDAIYYKDATLHVPEGTKALYKKASGWQNFTHIDSGILEDGDEFTIQTIEGCDLFCQVINWKDKTCRIGFENVHWGAIPLTDENYKGGITIPSIAQGYTVIQIEQGAFTGEKGLEYVVIPNTVKTINDYAFPYCENLKEIVLPNGLISIGERAFEACKSLQTVVIPNSVNSIGKYAFANCMSLYSVTSLVNIPFKLDETVFVVENEDYDRDVMYGIAKLYVPMGRLSIYQQTTGWQKFLNIIERTMSNKLIYMLDGEVYKTYDVQPGEVVTPEPDPVCEGYDFSGWQGIPVIMPDHDVTVTGYLTPGVGVEETLDDDTTTIVARYDLQGRRITKPVRGVNVLRMSDGTKRKVIVK